MRSSKRVLPMAYIQADAAEGFSMWQAKYGVTYASRQVRVTCAVSTVPQLQRRAILAVHAA